MDPLRFKKCLQFTMANEGGYSNDPSDHGGATSRGGVTLQELRRLSAVVHDHDWDKNDDGFIDEKDLALLSDEDLQIAYAKYYSDSLDELQSEIIAIKVFDFGFNMGPASGVKLLQKAVLARSMGQIKIDGKLGPHTVAVANAISESVILPQLISEAIDHYKAIVGHDPEQSKFLRGWINRANRIPSA